MVTPSPPDGSGVSNAVHSALQSDLDGDLDILLYFIKKIKKVLQFYFSSIVFLHSA